MGGGQDSKKQGKWSPREKGQNNIKNGGDGCKGIPRNEIQESARNCEVVTEFQTIHV